MLIPPSSKLPISPEELANRIRNRWENVVREPKIDPDSPADGLERALDGVRQDRLRRAE